MSDACADPPARKTAVRQAIAKGIVSFYQKYVDELSKRDIKETFIQVLFLSSSAPLPLCPPAPPPAHTGSLNGGALDKYTAAVLALRR